MSVAASNWAWEADLAPKLKLVLLALAHCHNGRTGQCNPRVDTLAVMVGRSKRALQYSLKELEDGGYIRSIKRRKGARQASNQYALALDGVVFQSARSSTLKKTGECKKLHPESAENCTLYIEQESEQEDTEPSNLLHFPRAGGC